MYIVLCIIYYIVYLKYIILIYAPIYYLTLIAYYQSKITLTILTIA